MLHVTLINFINGYPNQTNGCYVGLCSHNTQPIINLANTRTSADMKINFIIVKFFHYDNNLFFVYY